MSSRRPLQQLSRFQPHTQSERPQRGPRSSRPTRWCRTQSPQTRRSHRRIPSMSPFPRQRSNQPFMENTRQIRPTRKCRPCRSYTKSIRWRTCLSRRSSRRTPRRPSSVPPRTKRSKPLLRMSSCPPSMSAIVDGVDFGGLEGAAVNPLLATLLGRSNHKQRNEKIIQRINKPSPASI